MKKSNDVLKFVQQFYFDQDSGQIDINNYGIYRLGLTNAEVTDYLHMRCLQKRRIKRLLTLREIQDIQKKFNVIAGANTCASVNGIILHYRWDVQRHSDVLFEKISTYFD